ncbi:hypothetical protein BJ322DRAFT_1038943 [Thelephora terrestris]|uniref:NB-ARC domain-containing protein n=1 Tax=Thelephora terrestris TaxID=56493 RepID=A0A9P6LBQ2_9AGAM|nr:hypothetical protein BJ322DRAFT_1038943 [Thelephora terrestris]
MAIDVLGIAKEVSSITPAKAVFGSVGVLLAMIKDSMANKADYVALGLACAEICTALELGTDGRRWSDLSQSVREAIEKLRRTVEQIKSEIEAKAQNCSKGRVILLVFHARNDKETIAAWREELKTILELFNTQLTINTNTVVYDVHRNIAGLCRDVSDIRRDLSQIRDRDEGQTRTGHGELPPPPPRALFGRDELIEKIVQLADSLLPIALIGAGGIGKTSIALAVLHDNHVKQRFGENRRFIRCDQFPATRSHFLRRLSEVTGAGVESPHDLTPLRPSLSSREMLIVLDNAESILDAQITDSQEIYGLMEELSRFNNICLCVTSRISTVPPECESLEIPTLSREAAQDAFCRIYKVDRCTDLVSNILEQLDFHPLSVTLLATVAYHNKWDTARLVGEWEKRRTNTLHTQYNQSLAATIELSLSSPMFRSLGPDAREILGVVAFFPHGVDENNFDWLFPTITNRKDIFDKFCVLSLTYRSNGFITMLAPLRDYLCPKDPNSSPLLHTTKQCYFSRLTVNTSPNKPGFEETRWITSEDVNVEHLLDVFTSVDPVSNDAWDASAGFVRHLSWHKRRPIVLGTKIEGLPDDHPSKPRCLFDLSQLLAEIFNHTESRLLLTHTLKLWKERGDELWVAQTLRALAHVNWQLDLVEEAIPLAKETSEIFERLNDTAEQTNSLQYLALLLAEDDQIDAAEESASHAINLSSDEPTKAQVCEHLHILSHICRSRGETEAAIGHLDEALGIAHSIEWQDRKAR